MLPLAEVHCGYRARNSEGQIYVLCGLYPARIGDGAGTADALCRCRSDIGYSGLFMLSVII